MAKRIKYFMKRYHFPNHKWKGFTSQEGNSNVVSEGYYDFYGIWDRIGDGVMAKISIVEGDIVVSVEEYKGHFIHNGLDTEEWMDSIIDRVCADPDEEIYSNDETTGGAVYLVVEDGDGSWNKIGLEEREEIINSGQLISE